MKVFKIVRLWGTHRVSLYTSGAFEIAYPPRKIVHAPKAVYHNKTVTLPLFAYRDFDSASKGLEVFFCKQGYRNPVIELWEASTDTPDIIFPDYIPSSRSFYNWVCDWEILWEGSNTESADPTIVFCGDITLVNRLL